MGLKMSPPPTEMNLSPIIYCKEFEKNKIEKQQNEGVSIFIYFTMTITIYPSNILQIKTVATISVARPSKVCTIETERERERKKT